MSLPSSVVLSTLEFDVLWADQRFARRHVALDVPSPGVTTTERAKLVRAAWDGLEARGLAARGRAVPELADRLALLANPERSVDTWVWTDRVIRGLAVAAGRDAQLGVIDREEVWLIPARDTSFVEAAVSVAGEAPSGWGRSVSLPLDTLRAADERSAGDPKKLILQLERRGLALPEAQVLAAMLDGMTLRGQFGVELATRDGRLRRAEQVIAFHDTPRGRYLYLTRRSPDGQTWATVTPADNVRLAQCVWELLEET
ncbi:MAG TPA: ESX secretion-associated protein EspG [Pseudonocardiaceae bacterium]|jgi:surface antigen|nr:ESX secretion-associated protein EspG [Pseudonocardiaceae bacterium]